MIIATTIIIISGNIIRVTVMQGVNSGFCLAYNYSLLLWEMRMFPYNYKSLFEICKLPNYWPTKLKFFPTFRHL